MSAKNYIVIGYDSTGQVGHQVSCIDRMSKKDAQRKATSLVQEGHAVKADVVEVLITVNKS